MELTYIHMYVYLLDMKMEWARSILPYIDRLIFAHRFATKS